MIDHLNNTWVALIQAPLLWLTLTVGVYVGADRLYQRTQNLPLLHPVLVAIAVLVALLYGTGVPYQIYFDGVQFLHFLLGPATVALAIPLYVSYQKVQQMLIPIVVALLMGSLTAIVSAIALGWWLGASEATLLSFAPKSVTTPIAMGIAEKVGGLPSLTAVLVILTGIIGAAFGQELLGVLGIREPSVCGFAIGLAAHGIGTARAFQISQEAGAFSGLAMGLNGVLTTVLVPLLVWLGHFLM